MYMNLCYSVLFFFSNYWKHEKIGHNCEGKILDCLQNIQMKLKFLKPDD